MKRIYYSLSLFILLGIGFFANAQEKLVWSRNAPEDSDFFDETNWNYDDGTSPNRDVLQPGCTIGLDIEIQNSTINDIPENILMAGHNIDLVDAQLVMYIPNGNGLDLGGFSLSLSNSTLFSSYVHNATINLNGKSSLYLYAIDKGLDNTSININSENSWIYLINTTVEEARSSELNSVLINGETAVWDWNEPGYNCEVIQFNQGSAIVPLVETPLTLWSNQNFTGQSLEIRNKWSRANDFGSLNNNASSFLLKKGYMAVFLDDEDGKNLSKTYIALDEDLRINFEPEVNNLFSSVRLVRWKYASKKGACYVNKMDRVQATNPSWWYEWEIKGWSTAQMEFAHMMRGNRPYEWDLTNSNWNDVYWQSNPHLLYTNEPDASNQGNTPVEDLIERYPNYIELGLRLGSPSYTDNARGREELEEFVTGIKNRNQRLDFLGVHYYQRGTPQQLRNRLTDFYTKYQLPMWITEINHGCTWTGSDKTEEETRAGVEAFLEVLDDLPFVERYAFFSCGAPGNPYSFWKESLTNEETAGPEHLNSTGQLLRNHIAPSSKGFTPPYYNILKEASITLNPCNLLSNNSHLEKKEPKIMIYPNPASNTLRFKESSGKDLYVRLYDLKGRLLVNQVVSNSQKFVNISLLSKGQYILTVKREQYTENAMIIKL